MTLYRSDGELMAEQDWADPHIRTLSVSLDGRRIADEDGETSQDRLMLCVNGHHEPVEFTVPGGPRHWTAVVCLTGPGTSSRVRTRLPCLVLGVSRCSGQTFEGPDRELGEPARLRLGTRTRARRLGRASCTQRLRPGRGSPWPRRSRLWLGSGRRWLSGINPQPSLTSKETRPPANCGGWMFDEGCRPRWSSGLNRA